MVCQIIAFPVPQKAPRPLRALPPDPLSQSSKPRDYAMRPGVWLAHFFGFGALMFVVILGCAALG